MREAATGDFWQSVSGVLAVTGNDGRSGTSISAVLEASTNNNPGFVVPSRTIDVDGRWSCRSEKVSRTRFQNLWRAAQMRPNATINTPTISWLIANAPTPQPSAKRPPCTVK